MKNSERPLRDYWHSQNTHNENQTPNIFLHGFTCLASDWHSLWQKLPEHRLLALDLPSHGTNPQDDSHFEAMARQFWQDLDAMGFDQIHLVGYSMGGRLALYLAVMFPQRIQSLVLISASPGLAEKSERIKRRQADEALAVRLEQQGLESFLEQWYQQELFAGLRQWEGFDRLLQDKLMSHQAHRLAQSLRQAGTGMAPSMWSHLSELQIPTLFVSGNADQKFCQLGQQMQSLCPGSIFTAMPGGHAPHLESTHELADLLTLFWSNIALRDTTTKSNEKNFSA